MGRASVLLSDHDDININIGNDARRKSTVRTCEEAEGEEKEEVPVEGRKGWG